MFYLIAIIWLVLDQVSKYYVMNHFAIGESVSVIQNVFHLTYIINRGAAFGMLTNQRWFFLVVAFILIIVYAIYHKKVNRGPISLRIGSALLISGAIGNGIDRYSLKEIFKGCCCLLFSYQGYLFVSFFSSVSFYILSKAFVFVKNFFIFLCCSF